MVKKGSTAKPAAVPAIPAHAHPATLLDTRVGYCGDPPCNLQQPAKLPNHCVDLIGGVYIDPPFNSNRNYEIFWGETKAPLRNPSRAGTPPRPVSIIFSMELHTWHSKN